MTPLPGGPAGSGQQDRVMVFIDYQNAHGWARRQFQPVNAHPAVGHVDPLRLARLLVSRRRRLSTLDGVRIYRGRPAPAHQPTAAAANDRQAANWERSGLVTVIRRPLRYPTDWPSTPDVKTDWTVRDDVRAKLRSSIKRLLVKHRYPPDKQPEAIKLVNRWRRWRRVRRPESPRVCGVSVSRRSVGIPPAAVLV